MPMSSGGHKIKAPERNTKCKAEELECDFCGFKGDHKSALVFHLLVKHSPEELVKLVREPERWSFLYGSRQETSAHERPGQPDTQDGSHSPVPPGDPCGLECDSESELYDHMIRTHSAKDLVSKASEEERGKITIL